MEAVEYEMKLRQLPLFAEPFSVPLLIDLGFSADALDPLFDNGIFREPSPNRAEFFYRAHRYGDACVCRVQAAEEACHSGQYAKAFSLLKRALEIWPAGQDADRRIYALKEMARCARHARDFGAARLAWEEILATCRGTGSAEDEIEAHNQLAELSQLL